MENLAFGFEMLVIGLIVVMVTLLLLALILICFSKIFAPRRKAQKDLKNGGNGGNRAAAVTGASESANANANNAKPEIVAAAMGALLFAFDAGAHTFKNPVISQITTLEQQSNMWAQAGLTRLLHLRQDFALLRRGKNR